VQVRVATRSDRLRLLNLEGLASTHKREP